MIFKDIILRDQNANLHPIKPISYAELGVKERGDLENWIIQQPRILGSELLLITSEYDGFDKSDKRLDLLALDPLGNLVIIELKRDAAKTLADLQAIRYAAFCSNMTFNTMVGLHAKFKNVDIETAKKNIQQFVTLSENFCELKDKPRIILAAGGFDDQELTSTVLWLLGFGIDITCVEITAYRMPDNSILMAPRVIIPLPETKDFTIRAQLKATEEGSPKRIFTELELLAIAENRGVRELVDICREMRTKWDEGPSQTHGGSFIYSKTLKIGWRSYFGINISGSRKSTPPGQLDVWIVTKNLAEATNQDEGGLRATLQQRFSGDLAEAKQFFIRLKNAAEAKALVDQLNGYLSAVAPEFSVE